MSKFTELTIKMLYAKSGNICAFPTCNEHLISDNVNISQIAHIISEQPNGPRHVAGLNPNFYDSEENLILLCGNHHKKVDTNILEYPIETLIKMKQLHETQISNTLLGAKEKEVILKEELYKIMYKYNAKWILENIDFLKPVPIQYYSQLDFAVQEVLGLKYTPYYEFSNEILKEKIIGFYYDMDNFTSLMGELTDYDGSMFCVPNYYRIEESKKDILSHVQNLIKSVNDILN